MQRYHNPFAGIDLIIPMDQREAYDRYCHSQARGLTTSIDLRPFPRMVDLWFAGLSLAARQQLTPVDLSGQKTSKFHDGSILDSDSWRIQIIMLVAIAIDGNVDIVGEPHRIITLANGLAAAGVPYIIEMLQDGDQDPIWNLSDALDEILRKR